jgi:hypothetical protein
MISAGSTPVYFGEVSRMTRGSFFILGLHHRHYFLEIFTMSLAFCHVMSLSFVLAFKIVDPPCRVPQLLA